VPIVVVVMMMMMMMMKPPRNRTLITTDRCLYISISAINFSLPNDSNVQTVAFN